MTARMEKGFLECVGVIRLIMNAIGIWPLERKQNLLLRSPAYVLIFFLIFFIIIPQTFKAIIVHNDLNLMIEVLTTANIIEGISLLKLFAMMYNSEDIKKLLMQISKDWQSTNSKQQIVMWKNARVCKIVSFACIAGSISSAIMHTVVFFITFKANVIKENVTTIRPLFLQSYFPFYTQKTPVYEFICVCQFIAAFFSCFAFSSFDGLFVCTILHFSGQLFNLKQKIRNLIYEHRLRKTSFSKTLETVISRHQQLVSNTDTIEQDFNKVFLLQMVATSIILCLQGYQFVTIVSEGGIESIASIIFIVVYSLANLLSLFMYCYIGETIHTESQSLFFAVYEMQWYELPAKDLGLLLIIMNRFTVPIKITVGKFADFSLEYFTSVMKTSAGYLSVLLAVKQKQ